MRLIYDSNTLFRITLQVFLDRFVEREIQSLLVHCIHQEEGCDWKDELRKREVTTKLLYDAQISHDVYPLPALLTVRKIQTHRALFGHLFFNIRCVTVHKDEREKRTEQY